VQLFDARGMSALGAPPGVVGMMRRFGEPCTRIGMTLATVVAALRGSRVAGAATP